MSDPLQMFIPLRKADAARRMIHGYATAELPDRSGEICDYASTKPYYEQWSEDFAKASGGKSLGNLRAMHGKVAAGKISAITFNDEAKRIEIAAKIVDDDEWRKIEEGVYTGFSQGGAYVKRWPDPDNPDLPATPPRRARFRWSICPACPKRVSNWSRPTARASGEVSPRLPPKRKAKPSRSGSAMRAWLVGNVDSDVEAAETIADFFAALEADLDADPIHDAPLSDLLARVKERYVALLQPKAAQKAARFDARLDKLASDSDAARRAGAELAKQIAALGERIAALEAAPAQPIHLPGFSPVSKSAESGLDDLAAELARLSPEQASLVLIKAAQTQPKRFG